MPQHDLDIGPGSGAAVRADINSALAALGSTMRGPNAPPAPIAGMLWLDDNTPSSTRWTLSIFDGAQWIALGVVDTSLDRFEVSLVWPRLVGEVLFWPCPALPAGYLWCNGQNVSRATFAALYAAFGGAASPHGQGDGSTTFGIPDYRGRVPLGRDDMGGAAAGRVTQAISGILATSLGAAGGDQRLQNHGHPITDPGHTHQIVFSQGGGGSETMPQRSFEADGSVNYASASATTGITVGSAGAGNAQNMPPALVTNFIIFAGA